MGEDLDKIKSGTVRAPSDDSDFQPQYFRLSSQAEEKRLEQLFTAQPGIQWCDQFAQQAKELVKNREPKRKWTEEHLQAAVDAYLGQRPLWMQGVWVYFPWSRRLVHILDEPEFKELRTNRNRYKITEQEQDLLSTKKIGVIGLSVGQSVALTLAMERAFGELRIADFDTLDLSNLNRLRTGLHNLGLPKTVIVAREIAELDPFLKVRCFHQGITEDNIDAFLTEDGQLDLLIDECDGLDIKILSRIKAKAYGIPMVMEASDRATIDVERFDLEPERSILHGLIDHLDISKVKDLKTSEEKVPYILPIAGVETLSSRMKASLLEVGETLSTWPQLASAVNLGGGITADVSRRVLLDLFHQSGRYFIDVEELIGDPQPASDHLESDFPPLNSETMAARVEAIGSSAAKETTPPESGTVEEIVKAAAVAPSAGNNQPWKWYFDGHNLWLFHDAKRSHSFGDYQSMAAYIALGTSLENARLRAESLGVQAQIELFPSGTQPGSPVARLGLHQRSPALNGSPAGADPLSAYIFERCTNRSVHAPAAIPETVFQAITAAVEQIPGARFSYLNDSEKLAKMALVTGKAEKLRIFIPEGHHDLFQRELRWTDKEARETGDGIDLATFDLNPTEYIGLRLAKSPEAVALLQQWDKGGALEELTGKGVRQSSAVGLISMPAFSPENFLLGGRAVERMWLAATKANIAIQPVLAAVLHFARLVEGKGEGMPLSIQKEFKHLYKIYSEIWGNERKDRTDLFLFRMFVAPSPDVRSFRLPFNAVYFNKATK